jgi:hypothetical protein
LAKLWDVPVVFACENNKYGMGTAVAGASALTEYYKRGQYIPGLKVNGMAVLAVKQAAAFAKEYAVSGKGPLVMEFVTYRYGGQPTVTDVMFKDIYVLGSEPRWMLGRDAGSYDHGSEQQVQCAGDSLRDPVAHLIEG